MKHAISLAGLLSILTLASPARAGAWRCVDEPGGQDCQEALINDIEDATVAGWPDTVVLAMPEIPYSCGKPVTTHPVPGLAATQTVTGTVAWSIVWQGDLRSFLIGRHTAAADLAGTIIPSSGGPSEPSFPDTAINFLFGESAAEVGSPSGPTGVGDLGAVQVASPTGAFWAGTIRFNLDVYDGDWSCAFGYAGKRINVRGKNVVFADYPVALTPVRDVLAEAVRDQFRRAVRLVVTGAP